MRSIRESVGSFTGSFDAALVSAADAQRIVDDAVSTRNMLYTVIAMAARRVSETELWRREGDASAAHQLARKAGTTVGRARQALETAGHLGGLPSVEAAARRGELSAAQVAPIADAASKAPASQARLLAAAQDVSLGELLDACARTKAAALPDDEARQAAIYASRFLRRRRCADGAGELCYRSTLEEVAEIFAIAQGFADRRFRAARAEGRHQPGEAYLADGLLDAARASQTGSSGSAGAGGAGAGSAEPFPDERLFGPSQPESAGETPTAVATGTAATPGVATPAKTPRPIKVLVRIDWDALARGWPIDGEVCEIAGLGPVPVSAVRAMIASGDAFLAAVVTKGVDVVNVAHLGRSPTAHQRSGLEWRSPECTTLGCNTTMRLENDHRVPWAQSKVTLLSGLDPACGHCHDLKTYQNWAWVEGAGKRPMVPPDDPRHPRHRDTGRAPPSQGEVA